MMDLYARTLQESAARKEMLKRRQIRLAQVRKQAANWTREAQEQFQEAKEEEVRKLIDELAEEAEQNVLAQIQEMADYHDEGLDHVGEAHIVAATMPNYDEIRKKKMKEYRRKARERFRVALAAQRGQTASKHSSATRLRSIRTQQFQEASIRAKLLPRPHTSYRPKSAQGSVGRARPKTSAPRYQESSLDILETPSTRQRGDPKPKRSIKARSGSRSHVRKSAAPNKVEEASKPMMRFTYVPGGEPLVTVAPNIKGMTAAKPKSRPEHPKHAANQLNLPPNSKEGVRSKSRSKPVVEAGSESRMAKAKRQYLSKYPTAKPAARRLGPAAGKKRSKSPRKRRPSTKERAETETAPGIGLGGLTGHGHAPKHEERGGSAHQRQVEKHERQARGLNASEHESVDEVQLLHISKGAASAPHVADKPDQRHAETSDSSDASIHSIDLDQGKRSKKRKTRRKKQSPVGSTRAQLPHQHRHHQHTKAHEHRARLASYVRESLAKWRPSNYPSDVSIDEYADIRKREREAEHGKKRHSSLARKGHGQGQRASSSASHRRSHRNSSHEKGTKERLPSRERHKVSGAGITQGTGRSQGSSSQSKEPAKKNGKGSIEESEKSLLELFAESATDGDHSSQEQESRSEYPSGADGYETDDTIHTVELRQTGRHGASDSSDQKETRTYVADTSSKSTQDSAWTLDSNEHVIVTKKATTRPAHTHKHDEEPPPRSSNAPEVLQPPGSSELGEGGTGRAQLPLIEESSKKASKPPAPLSQSEADNEPGESPHGTKKFHTIENPKKVSNPPEALQPLVSSQLRESGQGRTQKPLAGGSSKKPSKLPVPQSRNARQSGKGPERTQKSLTTEAQKKASKPQEVPQSRSSNQPGKGTRDQTRDVAAENQKKVSAPSGTRQPQASKQMGKEPGRTKKPLTAENQKKASNPPAFRQSQPGGQVKRGSGRAQAPLTSENLKKAADVLIIGAGAKPSGASANGPGRVSVPDSKNEETRPIPLLMVTSPSSVTLHDWQSQRSHSDQDTLHDLYGCDTDDEDVRVLSIEKGVPSVKKSGQQVMPNAVKAVHGQGSKPDRTSKSQAAKAGSSSEGRRHESGTGGRYKLRGQENTEEKRKSLHGTEGEEVDDETHETQRQPSRQSGKRSKVEESEQPDLASPPLSSVSNLGSEKIRPSYNPETGTARASENRPRTSTPKKSPSVKSNPHHKHKHHKHRESAASENLDSSSRCEPVVVEVTVTGDETAAEAKTRRQKLISLTSPKSKLDIRTYMDILLGMDPETCAALKTPSSSSSSSSSGQGQESHDTGSGVQPSRRARKQLYSIPESSGESENRSEPTNEITNGGQSTSEGETGSTQVVIRVTSQPNTNSTRAQLSFPQVVAVDRSLATTLADVVEHQREFIQQTESLKPPAAIAIPAKSGPKNIKDTRTRYPNPNRASSSAAATKSPQQQQKKSSKSPRKK